MKYVTALDNIEILGLSVRSTNALKRANVMTIGQLLEYNSDSLMQIRNLGQNSVNEISKVVSELNSGNSEQFKLVDEKPIEATEEIEITDVPKEDISILEFVKSLKEKHRKILLLRLSGRTLEEIGNEFEVTRERVRQITQKALSKKPVVKEDKYLCVFNTYEISKEDFGIAFQEPDYVYYYLAMISTVKAANKKHIGEAIEDENISIEFRKGLEKATYKNYITADGERILKSRPALVEFFVRNNCKNLKSFKDFSDEYYAFLLEHNLRDDKFAIDEKSYMNHLSVCDYALWNMNKSFRYYNINGSDKEEFLKSINISQYMNKEFSTLKIFRDYPELMKEYDIRDEYELHNYLKKIWPSEDASVKFGRMPTITVGESNRDEQALKLLMAHSPVGSYKLADLYEEEYGVKAATAMANYFGELSIFYHNGIYTIPTSEMPQLSEIQQVHMRLVLKDDFYTINTIENVFKREYPDEDIKKINPFTLKKIGFMVYSSYVVSNRYMSANDYFRKILTTDDIVDAREWNEKMYLPTFLSMLYAVRNEFEIVEYLPLQYMNIKKLNEYGVTKADLKNYSDLVKQFVKPNQFFTIHSLRKNGFSHELDRLGFDDWFYSSLLAESKNDFACRRVGGDRLFSYKKEDIVYMDLVESIVCEKEKISITSLQEYILNEYGFAVDIYDLPYDIKKTKLYYDGIMKNVYSSHDAYLNDAER